MGHCVTTTENEYVFGSLLLIFWQEDALFLLVFFFPLYSLIFFQFCSPSSFLPVYIGKYLVSDKQSIWRQMFDQIDPTSLDNELLKFNILRVLKWNFSDYTQLFMYYLSKTSTFFRLKRTLEWKEASFQPRVKLNTIP